ncbi:helix-turn-helix domain-containing protein [Pseudomonas syringae]|uniref:helix-turn-helix domain-containing protein n=1 Tax=Pseudomonas syringae TaxID=317 RepID=UPI0009B0692C|nr:helix-turn-helix domain-containing protein [Pseudomonas syringae]
MDGIGLRLRRERLRLRLSQRELGEAGGVEINTQGKYENAKRLPKADYLAAVSALGVDVLYVLTGQPASAITELSNSESMILANYRALKDEDKATISRVVLTISGLLADGQGPVKKTGCVETHRRYQACDVGTADPAANIGR